MKLAVITHTKGDREFFLDRCKRSVSKALPENAEHRIILVNNYNNWASSRVKSISDADLFAFVDDDDYISETALTQLVSAINFSGLGSACTDELLVDIDGNLIKDIYYNKSYNLASRHPRVAHHLFIFRKECMDPSIHKFVEKYSCGIDWIIRASVINIYGCIYVPINGYYWTQHPTQATKLYNDLKVMNSVPPLLNKNWPSLFTGNFPVYRENNI